MSFDNEQKRWEEQTRKPVLKRFPERKQEFCTPSGIPLPPILTPQDQGPGYLEQLGFPGEYPFTRGVQPTMYRGRFWTMRQYAGYASAEESNRRYRYLLEQGQTGLSVDFDLPTQMGYDSDDPRVAGEVGRVGMAVDSLRDFEIAFKDIPLERIGSGLTINAVACIMLAMYQAVAEKSGYPADKISATPQNDILKEMIGRGAWIFPVDPAVRLVGDAIEYAVRALPRCNPVSICGYHIRESGANPAQEMAYAFAIACAYADEVRTSLQELPWAQINVVVQTIVRAWQTGHHIYIMGNGGSAAMASHMTNDLNKLTINKQVIDDFISEIDQQISAQVRRGSQVHHMPQMMRAQIIPVIRFTRTKASPTSVAETARASIQDRLRAR